MIAIRDPIVVAPSAPDDENAETVIGGREKEFVPSPQLGQWSDEHDFKRILTANDNFFYPVRPQPQQHQQQQQQQHHQQQQQLQLQRPQTASLKSTQVVDNSNGGQTTRTGASFINGLPAPIFHSQSQPMDVNRPGKNALDIQSLNKNYPKFNEYVQSQQSMPPDYPSYLRAPAPPPLQQPQDQYPRMPFRFPEEVHRTANFGSSWNAIPHDDKLVKLKANITVVPLQSRHTNSHREQQQTALYVLQSDHPYAFDFGPTAGQEEPPPEYFQPPSGPQLPQPTEYLSINELEKQHPMREHEKYVERPEVFAHELQQHNSMPR